MTRARAPMKDTYSTHDVAKICCVTPTTVIRWIEDGLIPAFKTVGGHRRVRREDLERVCRERNIPFNMPASIDVGRILVVDDDPAVVEVMREVVSGMSHRFELEVAKDAFDAGRLVMSFRPQLVLLDLMMPGVDGFEVCSRLKRDTATKDIEVVATTGFYTEANMDRILSAGASACLRKPLDAITVRQCISEAFNLKESRPAGVETPPPLQREETPKVLVITQNADFRAKVREELAATEPPVEILTAQTGADALLVAQAAPPQFVILSMSVPDVQSAAVIETLSGAGRGIQIIAVHDAPTDDMRSAARNAGARMCLPTQAITGSIRELLGV